MGYDRGICQVGDGEAHLAFSKLLDDWNVAQNAKPSSWLNKHA